ncbi:MAG: SLBB domain-containing protein [Syntrophobacteraceae bacterium]|nr:SLBB domain-containing protein [Syntrophobacteraceae bacterium]
MRKAIVDKVREAGIVGAGGAGFPAHVKINADVSRVLANGASCEPLLMSDPWLMESLPGKVLRGLRLVMECTGAALGTVCLKGKHGGAMEGMRTTVGSSEDVELFELSDFYPAGDEQVLVYEVMKRVVPEGGIPLQVGAVVCNVESLINVANAVDGGLPVTERYLTVTGEVARPLVVKVPVGISLGEVIDLAGGATIGDFRVVVGGPMMGQVVKDLSLPVTKTTSGVILLAADHNVVAGKTTDPERLRRITQIACCQCSRCTDICPRNLLGHSLSPHRIMRGLGFQTAQTGGVAEDALICSECGICEKFACPMMISPREVNAQIKRELLGKGIKRSPRQDTYRPSAFRDYRKVPTKRLIEHLGLGKYDGHPQFLAREVLVQTVSIPLKQHLGAPAVAVVKKGDRVRKGDLIGEIAKDSLGARVHASIDGVVSSIGANVIITQ